MNKQRKNQNSTKKNCRKIIATSFSLLVLFFVFHSSCATFVHDIPLQRLDRNISCSTLDTKLKESAHKYSVLRAYQNSLANFDAGMVGISPFVFYFLNLIALKGNDGLSIVAENKLSPKDLELTKQSTKKRIFFLAHYRSMKYRFKQMSCDSP